MRQGLSHWTRSLACCLAILTGPALPEARAGDESPRADVRAAFDEGMAAFEAGDFAAAIAKFNRVLELDPEHDRARLELGRSYFSAGRYEEAREAFVTVLRHNPPETVQANIQLFLDSIERESRRFNFNLRLAAGGLYDDNVNVGPASDLIRIRPTSFGGVMLDTLSVDEGTQPQESWGIFGEASAYGEFDAGKRGDWIWFGGVDYYQTLLDEHTEFEVLYGDVFAGPALISPKRVISAPMRLAHIDQGHEELVDLFSFAPSYNVACHEDVLCTASLLGEYRDYSDVDERDAWYGELRGQVTKLFDRRSKSVTASLGAFTEDADSDVNSNDGVIGTIGGSVSLPLASRLDVRGSYRASWYDEREALAPDTREEQEFQALATLSKQIDEDWDVALLYQFTSRHSNFDLYDYDRNFVSLRVNYAY